MQKWILKCPSRDGGKAICYQVQTLAIRQLMRGITPNVEVLTSHGNLGRPLRAPGCIDDEIIKYSAACAAANGWLGANDKARRNRGRAETECDR